MGCIRDKDIPTFFITALVFRTKGVDGCRGDIFAVRGAEEVEPVEVVAVVEVDGVRGGARKIVARAAGRVREDGVGEGDFLKAGVGEGFLVGDYFVCLEEGREAVSISDGEDQGRYDAVRLFEGKGRVYQDDGEGQAVCRIFGSLPLRCLFSGEGLCRD